MRRRRRRPPSQAANNKARNRLLCQTLAPRSAWIFAIEGIIFAAFPHGAKRAMAAAELKAAENSWQVAITILDSGGNLVMFHKVDNAPLFAIAVSQGKAHTALDFKLPSKALDYAITAGGAGMRLLALNDTTPLEGGVPIMVDGKIVGAIGVAGALSPQDAEVAKAGADVLVPTQ